MLTEGFSGIEKCEGRNGTRSSPGDYGDVSQACTRRSQPPKVFLVVNMWEPLASIVVKAQNTMTAIEESICSTVKWLSRSE